LNKKVFGIVLSLALVFVLLGCVEQPPLAGCKGEGESIPVIAAPPECCAGLALIPPKEANWVGISGYCTALCGNGACNAATESAYNCPADCLAGASPQPATGTFVLLVSDAEADIAGFESVNVALSGARVFREDENIQEFDLGGIVVDLTDVVGEKAIPVLEAELEAGTYTKIELMVESVEAMLLDGNSADVKIPSETLKIVKPFTVEENEETKFVFDIEVVKKGQSNEYNLLPVISKSGKVGADIEEEQVEEIEAEAEQPAAAGSFVLLVSDAEANIADFESVNVSFGMARIFSSGSDDNSSDSNSEEGKSAGFQAVDLNGVTVDLTDVIGEKAVPIVELELLAGKYTKVELSVESIEAMLLDGNSADVKIPSETLKITKPFTVEENEETKFVFDIEVVKKGQSNEYNLLPVIGKSGVIGEDLGEDEVVEVEPMQEQE